MIANGIALLERYKNNKKPAQVHQGDDRHPLYATVARHIWVSGRRWLRGDGFDGNPTIQKHDNEKWRVAALRCRNSHRRGGRKDDDKAM